jgi:hypothetical protein
MSSFWKIWILGFQEGQGVRQSREIQEVLTLEGYDQVAKASHFYKEPGRG